MGGLLRNFRERSGMSRKDVAARLLVSESLAGAYERAERIPTSTYLDDADSVLDARGALKSCIPLMEEEKYPPTFVGWVRLEKSAASISAYETMVFPGLLQTEDYIRALYAERVPQLTEERIEKDVMGRLERQTLLTRTPPPMVGYVIEESVLGRPIGGREVWRKQLLHVLECVRAMRHLRVQVMPTETREHAGLQGTTYLLSTAEGRNFAYDDGQISGRLISNPLEVNQLIDRFGALRAQALTPRASAELIERMAGQL
ncbi:helix-turn-helix domain-containing protein [Streptomyces sp. SID335]|uniref:Transcriptional regulator n=1 Tax=Streptomyces venezuelae TaxID=54571 RepID=A0A5P2BT37_STRVZ|nr:helix-turn-helix domain-containing protein [Streptomyces sp. SID335]MYZ14903.1 helix-turn-helix domain-containing protein [Streptomyces sp. SID337]NDZ90506.1 helix-turn-helix domain-containing protein [Streptomyces sp. SID10115]NDZ98828.1 helix-turn-helix domain-containing protein [Streptomyces sp. SID10116]NEB49523.1 helix-turn-helix domain-containing protein [Streptomyces sp. SID339]QES31549.1 transcriptional regulator [Streptomyces venezuelae]